MIEQPYPQFGTESDHDGGELGPSEALEQDQAVTPFGRPPDGGYGSLAVPSPNAAPDTSQDDLERVRQIIMGNPDAKRQPIREAEASRMRDILFGAKMEEYDRRFADLRRELDRLVNDLRQARDSMDEFRSALQERLEVAERDMHQSHEELQREMDRLRSQAPLLQKLLPETQQLQIQGSVLDKAVTELRGSLTREAQEVRALRSLVEQYREQYERSSEALKREKRQAEDELKEELRRVADRLDDKKTDRQVLAAVLLEIATRLQSVTGTTNVIVDVAAPAEE